MRSLLLVLLGGLVTLPCPAAAPPPTPTVHWSFRPPRRAVVPSVKNAAWLRSPIDAFVLRRLEDAGFSPSSQADRRTLIRRVTFDLTGLLPTPEEIEAFRNDHRPGAYERLVDRLLASPQFGVRWGQHWLDVARYAETNGYEADALRPQAWRYRDWVVDSFNADLPFDRFLTAQVAGDLLAKKNEATLLIAAGFNRCGPIHQVSGNVDPAETRQELMTEIITGIGGAFLGLTMHCARCHDHKFDPISIKDYYRLEAFFSRAIPTEIDLAGATAKARYTRQLALWQARMLPLRNKIAAIDAPYRERLRTAKLLKLDAPFKNALTLDARKRTPAQAKLASQAQTLLKVTWDEIIDALSPRDRKTRAALRTQLHAIQAKAPEPPIKVWTLREQAGKLETPILRRGSLERKGPKVTPAFPPVIDRGDKTPKNRLALAAWLTRKDHPLTARVIVNRLWQHHFGKGIVATPNDFGLKGDRPSHPELLDWLATELIDSGWSLKHLHRLMVLSATYRQKAGLPDARTERLDPNNRLLSRMNRRRMEGESLRDSVLAVTGDLNPSLAGPVVRIPLEPEVYDLIFTEDEPDGLWPVTPDVRQHSRRSLYLFNKRNVRLPLLEAFDQPDTLTSCPVRAVSTFAPQALILLNGPFMQTQARRFAARVWREADDDASRLDRAWRLALGRSPSATEKQLASTFLTQQTTLLRDRLRHRKTVALVQGVPAGADPARAAALADLCLTLLNLNAFVYVD